MKNLTLILPDELDRALAEISRREQRSESEVALDLLEGSVRANRFRELRRETLEALGPDAPATDQQAFDEVS